MEFDALVVGASVAGCRTAELIASRGYKVAIVEEHEKIGFPSKCTGLVSWRLKELLPELPNDVIVNMVNKAKFFSPSGISFVLKSKKPVYVIDRKKLDQYLFSRALEKGCKPFLSRRFVSFKKEKGIAITTRENIKTKLLIGADGANSTVAKVASIKQPSKILLGLQSTIKGKFEEDYVELWFGRKIAPNFFAWVVPENSNKARVGLATNKNALYFFKKFLKKRVGRIARPDTAGMLRLGLIEESVGEKVLLVGDAACQVKPFSGGGIVYALIASEACAKACCKALENEKYDKNSLRKFYESVWKKKLDKAIKTGMTYRKILSNLSDWQLDLLFAGIRNFGRKILEGFDMDFL
jgi:geranylgeranyl reductase family protein